MSVLVGGRRIGALVSLAALLCAGCGCDDPPLPMATITIVAPAGGSTVTTADDVDAALDGIQIEASATSMGLGEGDLVDILVDDIGAGPPGTVDAGGNVLFASVTLEGEGAHSLVAVSREGGVRSLPVTVIVNGGCATITFVEPMDPATGRLTLGGADDTDGEMCGTTFTTTVSIATDAGDGSMVQVNVNGAPRSTGTVMGTLATIEDIALDNRGTTPNVLSVTVTSPAGVECSQEFPAQVFVDCVGASCDITQPDTMTAFLNASQDIDVVTPGFQGQFVVATDAAGVGQDIRLIIDGDETGAPSSTPMMVGMGGEAVFASVDLTEALHRFVAECEDDAGNLTRSGPFEWTVDITPCDITIEAPDGSTTLTDLDDTDPVAPGIQVEVAGAISGAGCTGLRVGACPSIDTLSFGTADMPYMSTITLGSTAMQDICAEVQDDAGNLGSAMQTVRVRTLAPQLEIITPTTGSAFNSAGTMGRTADLDTGTSSCEAAFSVWCTDVGVDVTILRNDLMSPLPGGVASCVADGAAVPPYMGRADFAMVSLPSLESLVSLEVVATQVADALTGISTPISVLTDCSGPGLDFRQPMCADILRPGTQDEDMGTPGFQYTVIVGNVNSPKPAVTLTLSNSAGMIGMPITSSMPAAGSTTDFSRVTFGSGGTVTMQVCATDAADNTFCSMCDVSVEDIPSLAITTPDGTTTLGSGDDCDLGTPGLQITVSATTDAADGSAATIRVGAPAAVATTAMGGIVTLCIDAPDGIAVPVIVTVTDARGTAMASTAVDIDSMPPSGAIDDFTPVMPPLDLRAGQVNFTWTAVNDTGGGILTRYEYRCSTAGPIDTEIAWTAAAPGSAIGVAPVAGGTMQMGTVTGFRPGEERWCALRGFDLADAPTPLASPAPGSVTIDLRMTESSSTANQLGFDVSGIGDINGDGIGDLIAGTHPATHEAYVYFGSATGPSTTPDITLLGGLSFGTAVSGLGDISGDGIPDFAVSQRGHQPGVGAPLDRSGTVFVFFGRPAASTWPTSINTDVAACAADLCFVSSDLGAFMGWDVESAGDFDGDGILDIVFGARDSNTNGRAFVILGQAAWTPGTTFAIPGAVPASGPAGFIIDAAAGATRFGVTVTTCGDLSGDARSDLIIGAPGTADGRITRVDGRAHPGAASGLVSIGSGEVSTLVTGPALLLGFSLRCVGDYNLDGLRDIGAWNSSSSASGQPRVYLQSGGTYSNSSVVTFANDAPSPGGDSFGSSFGLGYHPMFGNIGDIDNDMRGDLWLGSNESPSNGPGSIELFYGESPAVDRNRSEANASYEPTTAESSGGRLAACVGDVTGDGFPDLAVGDMGFGANAGRVVIYY